MKCSIDANLGDAMYGIIYLITNKINNDKYIGQTTWELEYRWRDHCRTKNPCIRLKSGIQKYGKENFEIIEIYKADTEEELNELEWYYIKMYNTLSPYGYNLIEGGKVRKMSAETREKMARAAKGNTRNRGRKHTEQTKLNMSNAHKGKPLSETHRKKLCEKSKEKRKPIICNNTGKIYSYAKEAAIDLNLRVNKIYEVANGKRKTTGNYSFSFYDK